MIVCSSCGHRNDDDAQFCASCKDLLEWTGERVDAPGDDAQPGPSSDAVPTGEPPDGDGPDRGLVDRFVDRLQGTSETGDDESASPGRGGREAVPGDESVPPGRRWQSVDRPGEQAPSRDRDDDGRDTGPSRPPAPPPTGQRPGDRGPDRSWLEHQPGAVTPDTPRERPVPRASRQPETAPEPGDLVCGGCGTGNDADRNFCRRCGESLAQSEVVEPPWWRRLLPRRREPVHAAGERPGRGSDGDRGGGVGAGGRGGGGSVVRRALGTLGKAMGLLTVVVLVLGGIGISVNADWRGAVTERAGELVDRVRRVVAPQYEQVRPVRITATSALPDHDPVEAVNDTSNRWWAEGAEGDGVGERLRIDFDGPVDIAVVGITSGAADPEQFPAQPRPRRLRLDFDTGVAAEVELADSRDFQAFEISAPGTTSVRIEVLDVWPGQSGSDMAITTIEFRTAA